MNNNTTVQGVLTILAGAATFVLAALKTGNWAEPVALTAFLTALTAGIGLIKAADATP